MTALEAIEQSIREDKIVTLDRASSQDIYQLSVDCDDSVVNDDVTEYWGSSTDEEDSMGEWRVHVRRQDTDAEQRADHEHDVQRDRDIEDGR